MISKHRYHIPQTRKSIPVGNHPAFHKISGSISAAKVLNPSDQSSLTRRTNHRRAVNDTSIETNSIASSETLQQRTRTSILRIKRDRALRSRDTTIPWAELDINIRVRLMDRIACSICIDCHLGLACVHQSTLLIEVVVHDDAWSLSDEGDSGLDGGCCGRRGDGGGSCCNANAGTGARVADCTAAGGCVGGDACW